MSVQHETLKYHSLYLCMTGYIKCCCVVKDEWKKMFVACFISSNESNILLIFFFVSEFVHFDDVDKNVKEF